MSLRSFKKKNSDHWIEILFSYKKVDVNKPKIQVCYYI